jgi:hypothetical protein
MIKKFELFEATKRFNSKPLVLAIYDFFCKAYSHLKCKKSSNTIYINYDGFFDINQAYHSTQIDIKKTPSHIELTFFPYIGEKNEYLEDFHFMMNFITSIMKKENILFVKQEIITNVIYIKFKIEYFDNMVQLFNNLPLEEFEIRSDIYRYNL